MIVRRGQAQPARRVLVAVDFSACSHRAARLACELFHEAEITLLNAYSVRHEGRMRIGGASDDDIAAYLLSEQVRAEAAMRRLSSALDNEKCCRTVTVNGSAASAILDEAATGFDVLVVGKTGEGSRSIGWEMWRRTSPITPTVTSSSFPEDPQFARVTCPERGTSGKRLRS